jgi:hypothetical protein
MSKLQVWSTFPGILGMLFFAACATGGILSAVGFWLPSYQNAVATLPEAAPILLAFMIIAFAAALFFVIILILSLFNVVPKALFIIFALLALICAAGPGIVIALAFSPWIADLYGVTVAFIYVSNLWYAMVPLDFIGWWLAAGGGLLAFIFGFFIPKRV